MGYKIRDPSSKQKDIVSEVQSAWGYLRRQLWTHPVAGTATATHANITLANGAVTDVTTGITQPDFPRTISIKGTKAGGSLTGNVIITGTNIRGETISDTIALNDDTEVFGVKAFKTITNIRVPARVTAGDVVSIGRGDALGLDRCMSGNEVLFGNVDGAREATPPTVVFDADEVEKNTADFNTALANTKVYTLVYISTERTSKLGSTA